MIRTTAVIFCLLGASAALAQDLGHKAPAQAKPVMIYNATVHPVSGPAVENGFVSFTAGTISGVGAPGVGFDAEKSRAEGWEVIDAKGGHVYPGLVAAYSQIGLTEVAAARATLDYAEVGQATPEVRASVAVNPDSTLIPVARTNGVMVAGVFPNTAVTGQMAYFDGPGGIVPGRASVMVLDGWTSEQMAAEPAAGLVVNWPSMRSVSAWWMNKSKDEQKKETEATLRVIERLFADARAYRDAKANRQAVGDQPADLRFEAMLGSLPSPAAPGAPPTMGGAQKPVFVVANDYDQIIAALGFGERHHLRIVIVGGLDAHLCTAELRRHDVPVIVTGVYRFPKRADGDYDEPFSLPAKLRDAGVRFCIASGEEAANERNLPYAAATAAAFGLGREEALRAITLGAAEVLGVADRFGSLEPRKSATLIITDGDVLEITTHVEAAWIDGRRIDLNNKQIELEKKYREKYRQLGTGAAK